MTDTDAKNDHVADEQPVKPRVRKRKLDVGETLCEAESYLSRSRAYQTLAVVKFTEVAIHDKEQLLDTLIKAVNDVRAMPVPRPQTRDELDAIRGQLSDVRQLVSKGVSKLKQDFEALC